MSIKQIIEFKSDNRYFAGFLQSLISEQNIKASVQMIGKNIELIIDETDPTKLQSFGEATNRYLPRSLFLGKIVTDQGEYRSSNLTFHSPSYTISPCPKCFEAITNPASNDYLNDSYKCTHYANDIDQTIDHTNFSVHYSDEMTLLLCDASKAEELFYLSDLERTALFSIEKPSIKVTIKDERLKEITKKNFIYIRTPYSIKSTLVALNAKESEIDYLFFDQTDHKKCVIVKENISFISDNTLTKKLESLHQNTIFNRAKNLEIEAGFKNSITASMSRNNGISFIVSNEVGINASVSFQKFDLERFFLDIQNDPLKSKMFLNFKAKFPKVIETLESSKSLTIFETLAIILELDGRNFEDLCDKSYEFRGNGGLKIDMYFNSDGFDYISFLGSIMSFKLAGSETHFLAYSIFEAYGDMIISTLNQLKNKFGIEHFIMMGDMFENSVLYSRILSKFQLSNPYFPINIALDGE